MAAAEEEVQDGHDGPIFETGEAAYQPESTIREFSLEADGTTKLSKNFAVHEFACRDGSDRILIDLELIDVLEMVRAHFGGPVIVNSGYRSPSYNEAIGGASKSQHMEGRAADIWIPGIAPPKIFRFLEAKNHTGGLGLYRTFVHVDTRPLRADGKPARWNG